MSNYYKVDDFDIYWVNELIFVNIRNSLIFIKNLQCEQFLLSPSKFVTFKKIELTNIDYVL